MVNRGRKKKVSLLDKVLRRGREGESVKAVESELSIDWPILQQSGN